MARPRPLHQKLAGALSSIDDEGGPYAEAWRRARPIAAELGVERPSYWQVRRFLSEHRRRKELAARRREQLERVVAETLAGRVPRV